VCVLQLEKKLNMKRKEMYSQFGFSNNFAQQQQPGRINVPQSTITIDDIIGALQIAKDAKVKAEQQAENVKQKPLDFNRTTTYYMVCFRLFANGHVWQPDSAMWPDEQSAMFHRQGLMRQNPNVDYKVFKLNWCLDAPVEEPLKKPVFEAPPRERVPPEGAFRFSDDEEEAL
jgi:hypothetical protein